MSRKSSSSATGDKPRRKSSKEKTKTPAAETGDDAELCDRCINEVATTDVKLDNGETERYCDVCAREHDLQVEVRAHARRSNAMLLLARFRSQNRLVRSFHRPKWMELQHLETWLSIIMTICYSCLGPRRIKSTIESARKITNCQSL
jgi:hypothetical protein